MASVGSKSRSTTKKAKSSNVIANVPRPMSVSKKGNSSIGARVDACLRVSISSISSIRHQNNKTPLHIVSQLKGDDDKQCCGGTEATLFAGR